MLPLAIETPRSKAPLLTIRQESLLAPGSSYFYTSDGFRSKHRPETERAGIEGPLIQGPEGRTATTYRRKQVTTTYTRNDNLQKKAI